MTTILTIIHILVSVFLVVIVLLQHGKGADIGATFGGASQTLFGTEGPLPLLNKVTTAAAIVFMATSLALAYLSAHPGKGSVMGRVAPPPVPAPAPATEPAPAPATPAEPVAVPATTETSESFPGGQPAPAAEESQPSQGEAPAAAPTDQPTSEQER
ncbi:MAG TPA: preprotein translocase subunit SecG [Desulfobacterales bacterium]|nr:preprotein translocase subunit SecG [Desulfobacterales bacterium]